MAYLRLILAIAADLRAKDYQKAAADFIALLQLITGNPPPSPITPTFPTAGLKSVSVDQVAAELEAFAKEHEANGGDGLQANGEFLKKLFDLVIKLLPYILAGL